MRTALVFGLWWLALNGACSASKVESPPPAAAVPAPAQPVTVTSSAAAEPTPSEPLAAAKPKPFECTVVLGLKVTGEWFEAGFEQAVGDARFQSIVRPHTFVRQWANPDDPVWSQLPQSPCEQRASNPDRVLFFAADWKYQDEAEWITGLTAAVNAIRFKYRAARAIELLTMVRGPGNVSCGDPKSRVEPFVDRAIDRIVEQHASLVVAGPRFEVPNCAAFEKGGPHFTAEGRSEVARLIAARYAQHGP